MVDGFINVFINPLAMAVHFTCVCVHVCVYVCVCCGGGGGGGEGRGGEGGGGDMRRICYRLLCSLTITRGIVLSYLPRTLYA